MAESPSPDSDLPLLEVDRCSKKFCRTLKRSLLYGLCDAGRECLGLSKSSRLRKKEFWALREVCFQLRRGECLGLIGPNGAGKSTLLKIISGLIKPDEGRITVRGQVGALIELNAGMNPLLTGRENIFVLGAMRGMNRRQIAEKFDSIVEFSELGEFLDMPVKSYSSGMKVRLGFSVAVQFEPDLLIIDEVLAVGDASFRVKCLNKLRALMSSCGVIFVSHSMANISNTCDRVILVHDGHFRLYDDVNEGIAAYFAEVTEGCELRKSSTLSAEILGLELRDGRICRSISDSPVFEAGGPFGLSITIHDKIGCSSAVRVRFVLNSLDSVMVSSSYHDQFSIPEHAGTQTISMSVRHLSLSPGQYTVVVTVFSSTDKQILAKWENAAPFVVKGDPSGGLIPRMQAEWSWESQEQAQDTGGDLQNDCES